MFTLKDLIKHVDGLTLPVLEICIGPVGDEDHTIFKAEVIKNGCNDTNAAEYIKVLEDYGSYYVRFVTGMQVSTIKGLCIMLEDYKEEDVSYTIRPGTNSIHTYATSIVSASSIQRISKKIEMKI